MGYSRHAHPRKKVVLAAFSLVIHQTTRITFFTQQCKGQILNTEGYQNIWHVFARPVIMSLAHGMSTVTKHGKWSCKGQKKGLAMYFTWPYLVTLLRVYILRFHKTLPFKNFN